MQEKNTTTPRVKTTCGEEHLKDPIVALDKALKCVDNSNWRSRPECLVEECLAMAGVGILQSLWDKADLEGRLASLGSDG